MDISSSSKVEIKEQLDYEKHAKPVLLQFIKEGRSLKLRDVRSAVGKGSFGTISEFIQRFQAEMRQQDETKDMEFSHDLKRALLNEIKKSEDRAYLKLQEQIKKVEEINKESSLILDETQNALIESQKMNSQYSEEKSAIELNNMVEKASLESTIHALEDMISDLKEKLESADHYKELHLADTAKSELEIKHAKLALTEKESEIIELRVKVQDFYNEKTICLQEIATLNARLHEKEEHSKESISRSNDQIDLLEKKLHESSLEIKKLQESSRLLVTENLNLKNHKKLYENITSEMSDLKESLKEKHIHCKELEKMIISLKDDVHSFELENERLKHQLILSEKVISD